MASLADNADCPSSHSRSTGFVLLTRDGENQVNVRETAPNKVWIALSLDERAPSPDGDLFVRYSNFGLLNFDSSKDWDKWEPMEDLAVVADMEIGQIVEINSRVSVGASSPPKKAIATFRLLYETEVKLGECVYDGLAFGAKTEIFNDDGTSSKLPGHFVYIPDLMISLAGMWDGGVRSVTGIRLSRETDWFGE